MILTWSLIVSVIVHVQNDKVNFHGAAQDRLTMIIYAWIFKPCHTYLLSILLWFCMGSRRLRGICSLIVITCPVQDKFLVGFVQQGEYMKLLVSPVQVALMIPTFSVFADRLYIIVIQPSLVPRLSFFSF